MEKRFAASAAIYNHEGKVLLAKRSSTKFPYPDEWSLPSTYIIKDGKFMHELVSEEKMKKQLIAVIKRKLDIEVELIAIFGKKEGEQADYYLTMADFIGKITEGEIKLNGKDFSEAGFYDPIDTFGENPKGFCSQVLMTKLKEDKDFWRQYL